MKPVDPESSVEFTSKMVISVVARWAERSVLWPFNERRLCGMADLSRESSETERRRAVTARLFSFEGDGVPQQKAVPFFIDFARYYAG